MNFYSSLQCVNVNLQLTGRYIAPEVYSNGEYDTKVDVFSFALILQEVRSNLVLYF